MARVYLKVKEVDNQRFYYRNYGEEGHGRNSYRLWVHYSLVQTDENGDPYIEFPIAARIDEGKKPRTLILRPDNQHWVTAISIKCGYRGESSFEIREEGVTMYPYYIYHSPRGRLGVSMGALLEVPNELNAITLEWERTGRLYGEPANGVTIVYRDGRVEEIEGVSLEDLEELKELGELNENNESNENPDKNKVRKFRKR